MRTLLPLALLTACWSSSSSPPPPAPATEPIHNVARGGPLEAVPVPVHSVWLGKYTCRQGLTALQLTIDVEPDSNASAIFDFGPHTGNPSLPSGSYRMRGTVRASSTARLEVQLAPDKWISQPTDYMMVGIKAESDLEQNRLAGTITDDGCTTVDLHRIK